MSETIHDQMLEDLDLSVKAYTVLRREGYKTLSDVMTHLPYIAEKAKRTFKELCKALKDYGHLPYAPGDYVKQFGEPIAFFEELYDLIGEMVVLDVSTESRRDYKIVLITSISESHGERRVVFSDGGNGLGNLLDIYFARDKPVMYRTKESRDRECIKEPPTDIGENQHAAPIAAALNESETPVNGAEIQSTWRNLIMEITMTLTVTPTQAEQIAKFLQDASSADTAITAMRSNAVPEVQMPQPAPLAPIAQNAVPTAQQTPQMTVPTAQYAAPAAAPTAAPTYTIAQLQTALAPLLDAGKVGQIQQLVQSFGVNTLMEIPPARYGEFANGLRAMGGVL